MGAAYRFFRKQLIQADDPDDAHDIERIEEVLMHRLALVWIAAQPGDNVHRIFESLNNTGVRLSQADLLRNYIFMRMPNLGETAYETLWLPMQKELGADNLELLIWLDLVLRGEHRVRRDAIYRAQQERLTGASTEAELEGFLTDLRQQGEFLKVILQPEQEGDPMARSALRRLADWGSQTVYPLAMHLLARRHQGTIDSAQVADALKIVEGYLVRRMIVGKASANINRILVSIVSEMDQSLPVAEAVRSYLSGGERRWYPTDEQLRQAVLREPFYWRGKSSQRMFVLRRLEDSYTNFEPVQGEKLTIEHVMPQQPSAAAWKELEELCGGLDEAQANHQSLVHTLGNLTLSGYNAPLSNKPFAAKREMLQRSGLKLNQAIAAQPVWGPEQIAARGEELLERCVGLWPGPLEGVGAEPPSNGNASPLAELLAALPPGSWTTYGDVAEVLGTHPVPVGQQVATVPMANAHRVLTAEGRVSSGFRWTDPDRIDDPVELMKVEGVRFLPDGAAHPAQRLTATDLAVMLGMEVDEPPPPAPPDRWDEFVTELGAIQPADVAAATLAFLEHWVALGGERVQTNSASPRVILKLRPFGHDQHVLWCGAIDPLGRIEIWFQQLKMRFPFDAESMRNELRCRLNKAAGIEIPEAKLGLRPSAKLSDITAGDGWPALTDAFDWLVLASRESSG
ncbi:MAG: DUF1524 domain-containing protein [Acidimicrobiales bacterium]